MNLLSTFITLTQEAPKDSSDGNEFLLLVLLGWGLFWFILSLKDNNKNDE